MSNFEQRTEKPESYCAKDKAPVVAQEPDKKGVVAKVKDAIKKALEG